MTLTGERPEDHVAAGAGPVYFTVTAAFTLHGEDRRPVVAWTMFDRDKAARFKDNLNEHLSYTRGSFPRTATDNDAPHDLSWLPDEARSLHAHAVAHRWDVAVSWDEAASGPPEAEVCASGDRFRVRQRWSGGRRLGRRPAWERDWAPAPSLESDMALITAGSRVLPAAPGPVPPAAGTVLGAAWDGALLLAGADVAAYDGPHDGLEGIAVAPAGDGMVMVEPHDGTGPRPVAIACLVTGDDRDGLYLLACGLRNAGAGPVTAARNRLADAALQYHRESGGAPDPHVPPALCRAGRDPDGAVLAVDHKGREYQIRPGDGTVTVTYQGKTATAPAGPYPSRTARELAGTLTGAYDPPSGPYAAHARQAREIIDRIMAASPGPRQTDQTDTVPWLHAAARQLDNDQPADGLGLLTAAAEALDQYASWDFKKHIAFIWHVSDAEARDCATAVRALHASIAATLTPGSPRQAALAPPRPRRPRRRAAGPGGGARAGRQH